MTDRGYGCQGLFELGTRQGKLLLAYVVYNDTFEAIYPVFVTPLRFNIGGGGGFDQSGPGWVRQRGAPFFGVLEREFEIG
jgi:hypothetical protein